MAGEEEAEKKPEGECEEDDRWHGNSFIYGFDPRRWMIARCWDGGSRQLNYLYNAKKATTKTGKKSSRSTIFGYNLEITFTGLDTPLMWLYKL